jgi:hypothetical protein
MDKALEFDDPLSLYSRGSNPMMDDESFKDFFAEKLREGDRRMSSMESNINELRGQISTNTLITTEGKGEIREVLDILRAVKGGLKVIGVLGGIVKWTAAVGGAVVALYSMWKGVLPWAK